VQSAPHCSSPSSRLAMQSANGSWQNSTHNTTRSRPAVHIPPLPLHHRSTATGTTAERSFQMFPAALHSVPSARHSSTAKRVHAPLDGTHGVAGAREAWQAHTPALCPPPSFLNQADAGAPSCSERGLPLLTTASLVSQSPHQGVPPAHPTTSLSQTSPKLPRARVPCSPLRRVLYRLLSPSQHQRGEQLLN